jgi:lipopolysaccharide/colanic/teichoic acid biosynthesis glycosyltransferase
MHFYRSVKHTIEPVIALISLILLSPLLLIISIIIKIDSKGPVFFKHKRVGHNKKVFTLYKFRSMIKNAEELKEKYKHLDFADGPVFKIKEDPRLTRFGKLLSKTNIDELPQLINILKRDMYFVGFRPPTPDEVAQYKNWHLNRFEGYPGLTSMWVVSGMHKNKFDDWIRMDLMYNDKESFFMDLKIILKTLFNIFKSVVR